jgi:hypothetical protein
MRGSPDCVPITHAAVDARSRPRDGSAGARPPYHRAVCDVRQFSEDGKPRSSSQTIASGVRDATRGLVRRLQANRGCRRTAQRQCKPRASSRECPATARCSCARQIGCRQGAKRRVEWSFSSPFSCCWGSSAGPRVFCGRSVKIPSPSRTEMFPRKFHHAFRHCFSPTRTYYHLAPSGGNIAARFARASIRETDVVCTASPAARTHAAAFGGISSGEKEEPR